MRVTNLVTKPINLFTSTFFGKSLFSGRIPNPYEARVPFKEVCAEVFRHKRIDRSETDKIIHRIDKLEKSFRNNLSKRVESFFKAYFDENVTGQTSTAPEFKITNQKLATLWEATKNGIKVWRRKCKEAFAPINQTVRIDSKKLLNQLKEKDLPTKRSDIPLELALSLAPKEMTEKLDDTVILKNDYVSNTNFFKALARTVGKHVGLKYTAITSNPKSQTGIEIVTEYESERLARKAARGVMMQRTNAEGEFETIMFVPRLGIGDQHFVDIYRSIDGEKQKRCFCTKAEAMKIAERFSEGKSLKFAKANKEDPKLVLLSSPTRIRD